MTAPAFNNQTAEGISSMVPLRFVTIACGKESGFHGIVALGTTSKQLNKETDARFVGLLAALGEGSLALITLIAVSGVALVRHPAKLGTKPMPTLAMVPWLHLLKVAPILLRVAGAFQPVLPPRYGRPW